MSEFTVNGQRVETRSPPDTPLLWVLRDELGLKGTKFGCGIGQCGACTIHLNGEATRSCVTPVGAVSGQAITTIEGLEGPAGRALQDAWEAEQVPQCGYCQAGQLMTAASLLAARLDPTDEQITAALTGNLCRCMAYTRIRRAVRAAASSLEAQA